MPDLTHPVPDRDVLIEQHRSYARALAIKLMKSLPYRVDLEELVAYGEVGLVEAAQRYDPRRRVAFTTFAYYRIKGAIYDGLREMGYLSRSASARTRFAANAHDLIQAFADDEQASTVSTGSLSLDDEMAEAQAMIDSLIPIYLLSLDSDSAPDLIDENALSIEKFERGDLASLVLSLVSGLSTDEQQLIKALYFKYISMTELAAQMGVTKSWVSRLHTRAIKHLRDAMSQHGLLDTTS